MIVVLDTNVWFSELGLNSPIGAAVRFFLSQKKAIVALPEVVRLETEQNYRSRIRELVAKMRKSHNELLTVFGKLKELVLPDDRAIESKVQELFSQTGLEFIEINFGLDSARSSFLKTIVKTAPSDRSQEFKDGVLWHDCLQLLGKEDVCLVTADKAFYKERDYSKGIAESLHSETSAFPMKLAIFPSLRELLQEIRVEIEIDEQALINAIVAQHKTGIEELLSRTRLISGRQTLFERSLFITERPDQLYLQYTKRNECHGLGPQPSDPHLIDVCGECNYNTTTKKLSNFRNIGESILLIPSGGPESYITRNFYAYVEEVQGHGDVVHTVKLRLSDEL